MSSVKDRSSEAPSIRAETKKETLPSVSPLLLRMFSIYSEGYLNRHFHSLRMLRSTELPVNSTRPMVVFLNHASWWDPLVALFLSRYFFAEWSSYAPIDAKSLERYGIFKRLGFFGVERGTAMGAKQFLRMSDAILRHPRSILWLTPQGRFADVRERPVSMQAGLGHLMCKYPEALYVPLAIEYPFWEERHPEILVHFGEPVCLENDEDLTPQLCTAMCESALQKAQERLSKASQGRVAEHFESLLRGKAGVNSFYDAWRSLRSRWRQETFQPEHGRL